MKNKATINIVTTVVVFLFLYSNLIWAIPDTYTLSPRSQTASFEPAVRVLSVSQGAKVVNRSPRDCNPRKIIHKDNDEVN